MRQATHSTTVSQTLKLAWAFESPGELKQTNKQTTLMPWYHLALKKNSDVIGLGCRLVTEILKAPPTNEILMCSHVGEPVP